MLISTKTAPVASRWKQKLAEHWPEYASEGAGLGLFMISACTFGTLLAHPDSPVVRLIDDATLRRCLMGLAMGSTAVALIYSKLGKRSGAHMNPVVTLARSMTDTFSGIAPSSVAPFIFAQATGCLLAIAFLRIVARDDRA